MTWGGTFPGMYGAGAGMYGGAGAGMYGGAGAGMYGGGPGMYGGGWTFTESWPSDEQIVNMIYDSIDADPAVPYDSDINVNVTGGVVTLSGTVPSKRIKHDVGDDAWWVPGVWDVNNSLDVTSRRQRTTPSTTSKSSKKST